MNLDRPFKILFLCTGNSARSIFGEYLIRKLGKGKFESFSVGAEPRPEVNPYTIRVLRETYGIDASDARSKSWDESRSVIFDFVITVCDNARNIVRFGQGSRLLLIGLRPTRAFSKVLRKESSITSGKSHS
jgi:arsenate reductase